MLYRDIIQGSLKYTHGHGRRASFRFTSTGDRRPALARISVPRWIVVPDSNRLVGEYLKSKMSGPHLKLCRRPDTPSSSDKPQTFNQIVENFLGGS